MSYQVAAYLSRLKHPVPILIIVLFVFPFFAGRYPTYLLTEILILALFAYGYNLLFAYAGYLSFGAAAFYGLGGYAIAIMYRDVSDSTGLAILAAVAISGIAAAAIGYFCVKLGRIYFAMLTLAFATVIYFVVLQWSSFTNGDLGIFPVSRGSIDFIFFEISLQPMTNYYLFTLVIFLVSLFIIWKLVHSSFGYTIMQIRDNPERASFTGVNVRKYALIAFIISAFFCGLAGALMIPLRGLAFPRILYWSTSLEPIVMSLIGGTYTFAGPFIGALIYVLLKSYLMTQVGYWDIILGLILVLIVLYFRSGIMGKISERFGIKL